MFKYIITAAIALLSTPAFGQDDFCASVGDFAETSLERRYDGMTLSEQVAVVNENIEGSDLRKFIRAIVLQAYQEPMYRATKVDHILAFRNRWEVACYEAMTDYI